jgi:hypothetical protein
MKGEKCFEILSKRERKGCEIRKERKAERKLMGNDGKRLKEGEIVKAEEAKGFGKNEEKIYKQGSREWLLCPIEGW